MLNRRGFLAAIAAAVTLDPEKLLWVPGKKLISIPAPAPNFETLYTPFTIDMIELAYKRINEMPLKVREWIYFFDTDAVYRISGDSYTVLSKHIDPYGTTSGTSSGR